MPARFTHAPRAEPERRRVGAIGKADGGNGLRQDPGHPPRITRPPRASRTMSVMPLDSTEPAPRRVVRAACPHDCPDTCAMLVTVENGRAIEIRGAPDHPPTAGIAVHEGRALPRPHVFAGSPALPDAPRSARKGDGRFARISLGRGARRDRRALQGHRRFRGRAAGDPSLQLCRHDGACCRARRWTGASSIASARRCSTARSARPRARPAGARSSARRSAWTSRSTSNSRLILIWGSNPITSNLHFWTRAQEAKRRGAKLIAIDPYRSATAEKCHEHIALLPGTDAALAFGMMHVLIDEALHRSRLHRPLHARATTRSPSACANGRRSAWRVPAASPPSR